MALIIRPVFGFGSFPDGRLRAGPFNLSGPGELNLAMERHGLRPGVEGDIGAASLMAGGIMLSASGAGVRGYFLAQDGYEIPLQELDAFILHTVAVGKACMISGHWSPDADRSIVSEAVAVHDGRRVTWSRSRIIHTASGEQQVIMRACPAVIDARERFRSQGHG